MKITFMLNGLCTVLGAEHGEDPVRLATEIEQLLEQELGVDEASVVITAYEEDDE